MKVTKAQAAENREAIVKAAALQLRERGYDQMSVAEVARVAGLTHGALYSHFKSKDALTAEATKAAFAETLAAFTGVSAKDFLSIYLSQGHRSHPERGCPNAALVSEVWRQPLPTQEAFRDGLDNFLELAGAALERKGTAQGRQTVIAVFAAMVGGLALSRAVHSVDQVLSDEMLQAVAAQIEGWLSPPLEAAG